MKIAWLLYGSLDQRTGGTIYDAKIVEGLGADVHEVIDCAASEAPSAIVRKLVRGSFNVLVGDELCHRELSFIFPRCRFAKRVLLVHHLMRWEVELTRSRRRAASFYEAKTLRACEQIIATSQTTKRRLIREGVSGKLIDVVLPGADRLRKVPAAARTSASTRFLFIGAIIPRKRLVELVRALPRSGASLVIAGSPDRDPRYAREVRELSNGKDVSFLGEIDEEALANELARADALVMPSSLEGYGIAATEAIAVGTPVIAMRGTAGLEEALGPCPNAVMLADDLAAALAHYASDEVLRSAMREAARAAAMPTWAQAVTAFQRNLQR